MEREVDKEDDWSEREVTSVYHRITTYNKKLIEEYRRIDEYINIIEKVTAHLYPCSYSNKTIFFLVLDHRDGRQIMGHIHCAGLLTDEGEDDDDDDV